MSLEAIKGTFRDVTVSHQFKERIENLTDIDFLRKELDSISQAFYLPDEERVWKIRFLSKRIKFLEKRSNIRESVQSQSTKIVYGYF